MQHMLSPSQWNTVHIATSFCLVFLAFSVAQNFQTSSDHSTEGSIGLGILYGCFTLTNFVSAVVVAKLGVKISLIVGAVTYVLYVGANIYYNEYALYVASAQIGVGASLLWTAQGTYMTQAATIHETQYGLPSSSTMGMFNGLFWAIYQVNQGVGNLIAAALFNADVSVSTIFIVMTGIGAVGWVSLLGLRSNSSPHDMAVTLSNRVSDSETIYTRVHVEHSGHVQKIQINIQQQIKQSLNLIIDPRMLFLLPCIAFSGLFQTYAFGEFPPLIHDKATKFYVLAVFGAADMIFSLAFGKVSDRYGRLPCLLIGGAANLAVMFYLILAEITQDAWKFYVCGIGLAVGDATFNTQIYAILGFFFTTRAEHAFANFKLFQAGSTAVAFIIHSWVSFTVKSLYTIGFQVVGLVLLIICHVSYHPLHKTHGDSPTEGYQYQPQQQDEVDDLYEASAPTTPFHDDVHSHSPRHDP